METGDNTRTTAIQNSPDLQNTHVVIHLRYDGLSLLVCDSSQKHLMELWETHWLASKKTTYLQEEIEKFLVKNQLDLSQAGNLKWVLSFSDFCLIPDILYQQGSGHALLASTCRIAEENIVLSDFWSRRDIVEMYALNAELAEFLRSKNANASIAHNGYALNALWNSLNALENFVLLQVSNSFAELFITQGNKVIFYNQFPHDVPEDLLYYTLFTLEQNRLLAPEITLYVSGEVPKGEGLHTLLGKYIGKVEDVKIPGKAEISGKLTRSQARKIVNLIGTL